MSEDLDSVGDLLPQFAQLLVPLLNLLIVRLILNLQLLEVYQVQSFRQLLLSAQIFMLSL